MLAARDASWYNVVQTMALRVVHAVGVQVGLNRFAFDVEAEADAAIATDLPELCLRLGRCNEVVFRGSAVL